jgi:hypothetical protein
MLPGEAIASLLMTWLCRRTHSFEPMPMALRNRGMIRNAIH